MCLGILWCDGSLSEKAQELYDLINPGRNTINCNDRDFKPALNSLLNIATVMVFTLEPIFSQNKAEFSKEELEQIPGYFEDVAEEFLDEVFENESKISRKEWESLTVKN